MQQERANRSLRIGKGSRDDFVVIPSVIEACCTSYVSNHVTQVPEFFVDEQGLQKPQIANTNPLNYPIDSKTGS